MYQKQLLSYSRFNFWEGRVNRLKDQIAKLAGTDFFGLASKESHPRVRIRLLALGHLGAGKAKTEVADQSGRPLSEFFQDRVLLRCATDFGRS